MEDKLNRRNFMGLLVAAPVVGQPTLGSLLFAPEANTQIFEILKNHFELQFSHRPFVDAFTRKLQADCRRGDCEASFQAILKGEDTDITFERYVVEEFLSRSNYLMVVAGESETLGFFS